LLASVLGLETISIYNVASVYAHVWEKNEDALAWYEKRRFKRIILVDQYYRRLKPSGAWVLRLDLG
jgi:ribosomal protein S18 acetylase RimI-like enzyme